MEKLAKSRFITLEGCEGVGKSTQLKMLKEYLEKTGQPAVFTREPGGTPVAEAIRNILLDKSMEISPSVEAYLFATARVDHIDRVILPAKERGELIICDRYIDSSLAYQGVAREIGIDNVLALNSYAVEKCMPDKTIFIDMDPNNSWRKQNGKKILDDRMELESESFHGKCYEGYKELAKRYPDRIAAIEPNLDRKTTHESILDVLRAGGFIK